MTTVTLASVALGNSSFSCALFESLKVRVFCQTTVGGKLYAATLFVDVPLPEANTKSKRGFGFPLTTPTGKRVYVAFNWVGDHWSVSVKGRQAGKFYPDNCITEGKPRGYIDEQTRAMRDSDVSS